MTANTSITHNETDRRLSADSEKRVLDLYGQLLVEINDRFGVVSVFSGHSFEDMIDVLVE